MAIVETFRSSRYDPAKVDGRYVRCGGAGHGWTWIECQVIGSGRWDVRKGTLMPSDLPEAIMNRALDTRIAGVWPFWVEWPA